MRLTKKKGFVREDFEKEQPEQVSLMYKLWKKLRSKLGSKKEKRKFLAKNDPIYFTEDENICKFEQVKKNKKTIRTKIFTDFYFILRQLDFEFQTFFAERSAQRFKPGTQKNYCDDFWWYYYGSLLDPANAYLFFYVIY